MVSVTLKMVGNPVLNATVELSVDDPIFAVHHKIMQNHGGTAHDVRMWKHKVEPKNILRDMNATLRETFDSLERGTVGMDETPGAVVIYYDFSPAPYTSPLLSA